MFIPGFLITWVTFPGVIVHEFAHQLFCHWTGTRVLKVCYFRFGNPAGYVAHERPPTVWRHILIGIGPLFVNTVLGCILGTVAYLLRDLGQLWFYGLMWLAVSVAMHSFPSTGDAKSIWSAIWAKGAPLGTKLVGTPLVALIGLGALGSVVWLDLLYGAAVAVWLPGYLQLT